MGERVREWLFSGEVGRGSVLLVLLCGAERRTRLALWAAAACTGDALLLVPVPSALGRAGEGDPRFGRQLLTLDEVEEQPQLALRLREIAEGVYRLIGATGGRMWEPRFATVMASRRPGLVVIDAGRFRTSGLLWRLELEALVARVRGMLPTTQILVLAPHLSAGVGTELAARVGGSLLRLSRVVPKMLALRWSSGVGVESLPPLLGALRTAEGYSLVLSPTRQGATETAAACRSAGLDVYTLHGGSSSLERVAALSAVAAKPAAMVSTVGGLGGEEIPRPALLAWAQLPGGIEWILQLGELAEGSEMEVPYLLFGDLPPAGTGRRVLGLDAVRRVYATVRRLARRGEALIDPERAPWRVAKVGGPTQWWVAVVMLIDAGFLAREDDTMRGATLTWRGDDLGELAPLLALVGLRPQISAPIDLVVVAAALGWPVGRLLRGLLQAEDAGILAIGAVRRERRYRILPVSEASAERLRQGIESERRRGSLAAALLHRLISAPGCRRLTLAELAGVEASVRCGRCDRCMAVGGASVRPPEDERLALQVLARWPMGLPEDPARRAIRQALGDPRGVVPDPEQVMHLLATLRTKGLVETRAGTLRQLLLISEKGREALATWARGADPSGGTASPTGDTIGAGGE